MGYGRLVPRIPAPAPTRTLRTADPGLIGLLGFAIATLTAQLAHLGVQNESSVFWVGAIFGGVVQIIAGMLSFTVGDDFHFLVYNAFGWYWLCMPGFLLGGELGFFEVAGPARGVFTLMFAVLALLFTFPGAMHNTVLPITLLCVSAGLALQSVTAFGGAGAFGAMGSVLLIASSVLATYMLVEKFIRRTMGRAIVPLGPSWLRGSRDPES